jgi:selenocysteine-specific elongation factor
VKRLVLGVIGHVDHGKTALVRALTGTDTDRLAEEKARGISIALGFAHFLAEPDVEIDLIDMPGHERFVRTMVGGATGIDAVLLVVAANEGIKPQTVEHIDIAALLGLRRAVIAISKADLVSEIEAGVVAEETVELLARAGLTAMPPVMTSAETGTGIDALRGSLAALADGRESRPEDGITFLPIDRAFSLPGHGPVVTGTLRGASLAANERLELHPLRRTVRLRAIQVHGRSVGRAAPGQRVALNLRDVEIGELHRGMVLAALGALEPADWLTLAIRTVADSPMLRNGRRLRALFGTQEVDVFLRLLDRDEIGPGETGLAQLRCAEPVALPVGEHVILRLASPAHTVAGGRLLETGSKRLKRHDRDILERVGPLASGSAAGIVAAEVARAAATGTSVAHLAALTGLAVPRLVALLETLPVTTAPAGLVLPSAMLDRVSAQISALLALHPAGLAIDRISASIPAIGPAVVELALARLSAQGFLVKRESRYLIPRPEEDRARARDEAALAAQIAEALRQGGLMPPRPAEIVSDAASKRAVDRLLREGTVVRAIDRAKHKEILFHEDAIDEARRRLVPLLEAGPGLLVGEICTALNISRKYAMPLLDHLDTIRFTRRIGDRRLLDRAASTKR